MTGKSINVSLRVIADLSQGLYRSPADALKELVSNSYDADSPEVDINFSRDLSQITIMDHGKGMDINEFITVMETIGGSDKRSEGEPNTTSSGRKIVGRIGIGLLSVSQIAGEIEIESTVRGSNIGFRSTLEFDQFASEEARKLKVTDLWEKNEKISIGKYYYTEIKNVNKNLHFTKVKLKRVKRTIHDRLASNKEQDGYERVLGVKFHNIEDFVKWMAQNQVTKTGLHEYDRIVWELCVLCPVPYFENAITVYNKVEESNKTNDFKIFAEKINTETHLSLKVDGIRLFKPIIMPFKWEKKYPLFFNLLFMGGLHNGVVKYRDYNRANKLVEKQINVNGYIYFQRPKIWPPELQGLLIRVRNVAVGQYDSTFLTYRRHEGFKFSQITGEIYVNELDDALNIDRSSFRETDPSFIAFREAVHGYLSKNVFPGIKAYATEERTERALTELKNEEGELSYHFEEIDRKGRLIKFEDDQNKLIERSKDLVKIALSINGKKLKKSNEFYRIIAFLEAKLSNKLSVEERDHLFTEIIQWVEDF